MESTELWLIRDKPRPDELLSSWIVRLAHAQNMKLESFCFRSWGRAAQIMVGDTDLYPHSPVLQKLALHTGATTEQVTATTFLPLIGTLFSEIPLNGLTPWITRFGNKKVIPRSQGMSFCPLCLSEDKEPYCRRIWRMAFATVCTGHKIRLQQACPHCGTPFTIHRWDKGSYRAIQGNPITHCPTCRKNRVVINTVEEVDDDSVLEFQWILERALARGWVNVAGKPVHAYLFFSGLAMLVKMLLDRRRSDRVRSEICQRGFLPLLRHHATGKTRFEKLNLDLRHEIMQVQAWFFHDWPTRFIEVCSAANFSSSYLFDQATSSVREIPFWLWEPVHLNLDQSWYALSDGEIDAAVEYLRRTKGEFKKIDVVRLLGVSWLNKATLKKYRNDFH